MMLMRTTAKTPSAILVRTSRRDMPAERGAKEAFVRPADRIAGPSG
jgi:hypothetical protein